MIAESQYESWNRWRVCGASIRSWWSARWAKADRSVGSETSTSYSQGFFVSMSSATSCHAASTLAEEFAGLDGIEAVYLLGSWAARHAGMRGRPPADIDVLVIGAPDRDDLDEAAQRAGAHLAREVNVTIRSSIGGMKGKTAFITN